MKQKRTAEALTQLTEQVKAEISQLRSIRTSLDLSTTEGDLAQIRRELEESGFIHAKTFVSDDDTAVVGTINLDYRSLYLHFECATYLHGSKCIKDIKEDMLDMLENSCEEITYDDIESRSVFSKLTSAVLKPFAPLL